MPEDVELLIGVRDGLTRRLASAAQRQVPVRMWIDHSYSGLDFDIAGPFDRILLVGCGSGLAFIAPLMLALARSSSKASLRVIVVQREVEVLEWFERKAVEATKADIVLHHTGSLRSSHVELLHNRPPSRMLKDIEAEGETEKPVEKISYVLGRPDIKSEIDTMFATPGSHLIAACGPETMARTIRNASARGQLQIARGEAIASSVKLHTESFTF